MNVIIAAAGTGGHINPGIAIANKIKEMDKNSKILFIGTNYGLENDLVPRAGYELKIIDAHGIERKITVENIGNLYRTVRSIKKAKKIIKEFNADVVIGTGGYICMPVILAAKKMKIPTLLHESNAFPGVSVKLLSNKVDCVLVGFEDAKARLPRAKKVVVTGNPTKMKRKELSIEEKKKIINDINLNEDKPVVLAFGGSQGAQSINESLIKIIKEHKNKDYQIIWATGPTQYENIQKDIDIQNIENVKIVPYIYNMEEVMNAVDLVICRSGAMTITEVSVVGKPAIFIPFPYATENHQEFNARVLEKVGAAKIILDKNLNADILNDEIQKILLDKNISKDMAEKAAKIATFNVADKIYKEIEIAISKVK